MSSPGVPGNNAEKREQPGENQAIQKEADRLYAVLNADDVPKKVLLLGFDEYSDASKNEVVARVARTFAPPPHGGLLARLLFIRTPDNEASMRNAFVANLRSPHADARKFSLYGLQRFKHPALKDFALSALRDESDAVLPAAITILLPEAKRDPTVWALLQGFYRARKDQESYYVSTSLLKAHGIEQSAPGRP